MRKVLSALCLAGAAFFLMPLTMGVCHVGMFAPAAALLLLGAMLLWAKNWPKWLRNLLWGLYGAAAVVIGVFLWQMAVWAGNAPIEENEPYTVIVLGCRAYEGKPSVMLQGRINAAYEYLIVHPESYCVCSGGLDEIDEPMTQGEVIKTELMSMGMGEKRLLVDGKSEDTRENLRFSAAIIEENDLPRHVAIATDNFHEFRSAGYARRCGLTPFSLGCRSPWYLAPGYYCREMLAVLADIFIR